MIYSSLYRRLTRLEKQEVRELRKKYTDLGHEVLSLEDCERRFGKVTIYRLLDIGMLNRPLFQVGTRTYYSAGKLEQALASMSACEECPNINRGNSEG